MHASWVGEKVGLKKRRDVFLIAIVDRARIQLHFGKSVKL